MSATDQTSFDLVDQPWIPVRMRDGATTELSLAEVFTRAHEVATLSGDLPTQDLALVRLLLAILHRAWDGPEDLDEWERLWRAERLPTEPVVDYLDRYRVRFDLLHPETPFFQVAELRTGKGETSELSKLIADVPNGKPFFTTRLGGELSLTYAEAARWVVHCQSFDPAGIKSGAVGDDRVKGGRGYPIGTGWCGRLGGVLPEGGTLRETLLLNLIPRRADTPSRTHADDLPAWERSPQGPTVRDEPEPSGPVDLYTWQARRIRLVADGGRIRRVLISNGDRLEPQNRHKLEPHSLWRRSKAQEKKLREEPVYMPTPHDPKRAIWRGLEALLPGAITADQRAEAAGRLTAGVLDWVAELTEEGVLGPDFGVRVRTLGMSYGPQDATTEEVTDDALALRSELLRRGAQHLVGVARESVGASERAAHALGTLALNLAQAAGKAPPPKSGMPDATDTGDRDRAIELAYAELDGPFREWLSGLGPDTDPVTAEARWHRTANDIVWRLGQELHERAPEAAWAGRTVNDRLLTAAHAADRFAKTLRKALPQARADEHTAASA
ncbi:type I-E CRISPR-associated protein Cse1/CasA [Saccharomonospora iraqiensis]|uniref:type I-E CRISPR-associated protein Cse1/CasA n=1 Tax=Saccharomonospora iraqiensis TaxID=52698 RepID=UPI00022E8972|nr:type I-E CRISPR-associated protein Cse1/CasA [Saccharomonospora iraqiensis]